MAAECSSESLRLNGNEHFRLAKATPSNNVNQKRKLLWTALDRYNAGLRAAKTPKDRSLCCKNSAVMHKELAAVEWGQSNGERAWQHTLECVDFYGEAERHATSWKAGADWVDGLARQFGADLELLFSLTLHQSTSESFVKNLQLLCLRLGRSRTVCIEYLQVAVNIFADLASRLLHLSVSLENKHSQYSQAYKYIAEMHFPLQEALRLASRDRRLLDAHEAELEVLAEDQRLQESLFRSRVELESGKYFLANLDCNVDRWTSEATIALDHLKGALSHIDDLVDVALEAEICSVIGHAYLSLFKAESTAERYLKRCVELVLCFLAGTERHCRDERWFSTAENDLRLIQQRRAERETEEKMRLDLKEPLKAINEAASKGIDAFLTFVYSTHPPSATTTKPPKRDSTEGDDGDQQRKRLMLSLKHFHPDKCDQTDRKRVLIHEEITKRLNRFFERFK